MTPTMVLRATFSRFLPTLGATRALTPFVKPSRSMTNHGNAGGPPATQVTAGQMWVSLGVLAVFGVATVAIMPIASVRGPAMVGFVPAYQTAVCLFYTFAFLHLVAHVKRTGSRQLLHVAAGCLFSALILLIQMFSFPIWGATQLVGSTPATTSWLWCFWHLGPTIFTFSYVSIHAAEVSSPSNTRWATNRAIMVAVGAAVSLVATATAVATWALPWLPTIVIGDDYRLMTTSGVGPAILIATLASLGMLVIRTHCSSTVELGLAIALALLSMDDVLTLLGGSRLSWGWYAGRAEAAISAAVLLALYLMELNKRFITVSELAISLGNHQTILMQEMQEKGEANAALSILARQDGLTLLANRRTFDEALHLEWRRAQRGHQPLTLLMIDVDRFKLYNDRQGHQGGDACLQAVARLIQSTSRRAGDVAARYGGEEFALLAATDEHGGRTMAESLRTALLKCHIPHDGTPSGLVTISIGVATIIPSLDDSNADALVAAADQALYRAKNSGRDRVVSFSEAETATYEAMRPLNKDDLRLALDRDEFRILYQPQVDLRSGAVSGYEALLRWEHPKRGTIAPGDFIQLAEECGLIIPIGAWVLHHACAAAAGWPTDVTIAVNVSPIQFLSPGFAAVVANAMVGAGLDTSRLDLEITETARIADLDAALEVMHALNATGVTISLDDFGCGSSALSHVKRFPVSHIKIDRSFINDIGRSNQSCTLIRSIQGLASSLGIRTTAEGVETEAQLRWLREQGIDTVQGYLLGRPVPNEDLPMVSASLHRRRLAAAYP